MADNITVSIKVRPLIRREKDNRLTPQWRIRENTIAHIESYSVEPFVFDNIFDETIPTRELFDKVCRPIVLSVLNGINGTIFAYGQTSSGKTYTMMGDEEEPGVVPLAAREVFKQIENNKARQFLIRVGYIEIYNEKIYDLLDKSNANLKIFENTCGDVSLNYKEVITNCPEQVMQYLEEGNKLKRIGDTNMNERSSRSHTIFRVTIESRDIAQTQDDEKSAVQISTLNLVDLAGSERADQTGATGSRLKEGAHINKSLLSLSLVIQKLSENADNLKYINYRDSKLTRILQASLGGNAVTSMICNITPAAFEESYSTLSFATRAKTIKNKPKVNEVLSEAAMMKRLEREIKRLQDELRSEQNKNSKIKTLELQNAITMRANQIINSQTHIQFDKSRRRTWCPSGSAIPKPITHVEQDSYLMPPPPAFLRAVIDTPSATATSGDDESPVVRPELSGHHSVDLLARKVRSTTPSRQTLPLPFSVGLPLVPPPAPTSSASSLSPFNHSDEFVPGELADFGERSPHSLAREIHTPCALKAKRRSRRSSTGDSPANFIDHEKRCRELEQELRELQEFTNLEKNLDLADIKQQLNSRDNNNLRDDDLHCNQERVDSLEERCKDLELELKQKREQVFDVERELIVARKERETAVKEAEQCRNQQESIQVEYEIFQRRAKTREKELVECLQEARGDASGSGKTPKDGESHQKQLDTARKELKQLEVHNYELQLQLETCTIELEQLKKAGQDHAEKLEKIKSVLDRDIARKDAKKLFRAITSLRAILTEEDLLINTSDPEVLIDSSLNDSADSACQTTTTRIVLTNENGRSDVIHETSDQLAGITMENDELKKKLQQAEEECAQLNIRIEESSKQRELEQSKVGQLSKNLQQVEKEKQKLSDEYDELSTQVMDNIQDIENYKNLVVDLEKKLESASLEKQNLSSSLEQQTESLKNSCEEMLELRKQLEEAKQAQDVELAAKLEDLEKRCSELQIEVDSSKQLKDEMNQKQLELETLSNTIKQLQDENHDFMTTIQKHAQDIDELEQVVKDKDNQIQHLKQCMNDLESLKNDFNQLSATCEQVERSKADIEIRLIKHEEKFVIMQDENYQLTEHNKLIQAQLEQLRAEAEQHEQSEEVALKLLQVREELESAKKEMNSVQEELQASREKCDSLCNDLSRVTNENEQLRQEAKETTEVKYMNGGDPSEKSEENTCSECLRLQDLVATKEEAIKQAKEHSNEILRQIDTERKDFQERLSEASEKLLAAEQQRNQSEEQVAQMVTIQTELKNEINNLMLAKEAVEQEMSALKKRIEEFEGMLGENEKEKNKLMEESMRFRVELEHEVQESRSTLENLNEKLESFVRQNCDYERQLAEKSEAQSELMNKVAQLEEQIVRMQQEAADKSEFIVKLQQAETLKEGQEVVTEALEAKVRKLSEEHALLETQIEETVAQLRGAQEDKHSVEVELDNVKHELKESREGHSEATAELATIKESLEQIQEQLNETLALKEGALVQQQALKQEIEELNTQVTTAQSSLQAEKQRCDELIERIDALNNEKCKFESEIQNLREEHAAEVRTEKDHVGELEQMKLELSEKIRILQETHDASHKAIKESCNALQLRVNELENDKKALEETVRTLSEKQANHIQLEDTNEQLQKSIIQLNAELTNVRASQTISEDKLSSLKQEMTERLNELHDLRQKYNAKNAELESSSSKKMHIINEMAQKVKEMEQGRNTLQEQLKEERAKLAALSDNQIPSMKTALQQLSSEKDELQAKLLASASEISRKSLEVQKLEEHCQQEKQNSERLSLELQEAKLSPALLPDGRPSLGDGRVAQALRKENEDLLKQLNELQKTHQFKVKQLQDKIDELKHMEQDYAKLKDEVATMRHESSFQEKETQLEQLAEKISHYELVYEETNTKHRSLQRQNDELRVRHQNLVMEMDDLRRIADKDRRSRRQSTHDDRRGVHFNTRDGCTMTEPSSADCSCLEMDAQIKNLKKQLTIKDCQLNTQKKLASANPLKNDVVELRNLLKDRDRDIHQLQEEIRTLSLATADHRCNTCIRQQRLRSLRSDKAIGTDPPAEGSGGDGDAGNSPLAKKLEESQEELKKLNDKYQQIKRLCRIRNEKIISLNQDIVEKENESINANKLEVTQLKRQLKEYEDKLQQRIHHQSSKSGSPPARVERPVQTDPVQNDELEMLRSKYEKYKSMAISLTEQNEYLKRKVNI